MTDNDIKRFHQLLQSYGANETRAYARLLKAYGELQALAQAVVDETRNKDENPSWAPMYEAIAKLADHLGKTYGLR